MNDKYEDLKEDLLKLLESYKEDLIKNTSQTVKNLEIIRNKLEDFMENDI